MTCLSHHRVDNLLRYVARCAMLRVALLALAVYSALADGHAHTESCSVPAFTWWRVVNAERLDDHWNIGELEMFEPDGVGTANWVGCERACADMNHCCNMDVWEGSNQRLSCLQACKVRERGTDKDTCRSFCSIDGCSHTINGYGYFLCGTCADVPHHNGSNLYPNGQCSTQYGSDPQTCLDECSMDFRLADKIISVVSSYNYGQHQDLVGSYLINHTNQ